MRHYFIPHESNNFKARILHHPMLIVYLVLLFTFQQSSILVKRISPSVLGYATSITIDRILDLVNQERIKENLSQLNLSSELSSAAQRKASDMFSKNYWAHVSPTGTTPWEFITTAGYKYVYAGENLGKSFDTSEDLVAAWMRSPTHRANILKPEYQEIGLAVMNGSLVGEDTTLVVQEFGSRTQYVASAPKPANVIPTTAAEVQPEAAKAQIVKNPANLFLPSKMTRTSSLLVAEMLLVVLLIDSIFIWKHKTVRISGHSLAHMLFLAALLGAMGATGVGVIL